MTMTFVETIICNDNVKEACLLVILKKVMNYFALQVKVVAKDVFLFWEKVQNVAWISVSEIVLVALVMKTPPNRKDAMEEFFREATCSPFVFIFSSF